MYKKNLFKTLAITLAAANIMSAAPAAVFAGDDTTQAQEAQAQEPQEEPVFEEDIISLVSDNDVAVQQEAAPVTAPTEEATSTSVDTSSVDAAPTEDSETSSGQEETTGDTKTENEQKTETETKQETETEKEQESETEDKSEDKTETEKTETKEETKADSSSDASKQDVKEETQTQSSSSTQLSSVPATYNIHSSSGKTVYVTSITKENTPNAYKAACLLVEKGFTKEAAAGILGNFFCESGGQGTSDINPADDDGSAIGIAQWTGSGRRAFLAWCDTNNRQWDDIETQIDYLISNIESRWSYASQIGSVKALIGYGLGDKLHLDYESFKSCDSVEEAALSFLGVYEDDLYAKTARWAGFSSLNAWIQYETTNRLKCASDSYVEFFDGTALDIDYESEDLRLDYKKVEKDGFIVRKEDAVIYTDTDKSEKAGTIAKYAVVYKLADADKDGWYYVESGNVRGFIEKKDLYSDKKSKALIEKLGGYVFKEAENEIALKDNDSLDYTETTVYWFRNPSAEEFINYAADKAESAQDNAEWIKNACSFYNLTADITTNFGNIGEKVEEIKEGNVIQYKIGEDTLFAIAQSDGSYLTINRKGEKLIVQDLEEVKTLEDAEKAEEAKKAENAESVETVENTESVESVESAEDTEKFEIIEARDVFADTTCVEKLNNVPYYCQGDFADVRFNTGSVASDGCGITAFSMVASYFLDKQISPAQSAIWAMENGANTVTNWGSYKILANHYGITLEGQHTGPLWGGSSETIVNALKEGKVVIASMQGGYFNPSNQGHYIVYTGIDDEGHIYINDPSSRERTTAGSYSQEDAFKDCKQFWIFSK